MNRAQLRQLAEDLILDAELLLKGGRWSGAYYLIGYGAECGIKACIARLTLDGRKPVSTEDPGAFRRDHGQRERSDDVDTVALVENLIDDGQVLLDRLSQEGFDVTAAFWLKAGDGGEWRYYLASPLVDTAGLANAYRRLHTAVRAMPQPFWIDPLEIKLIEPENPITKDVLAIQHRTAGPNASPIRWGGNRLGDLNVEGAYLYPLPAPAPP